MTAFAFAKLEATGNDFIVVDGTPSGAPKPRALWCDRHTGIGADGVLSVLPARPGVAVHGIAATWRMHIENPDGSVPEMCGNGLRCVARHLASSGRIPVDADVVVDTDAGGRLLRVHPSLGSVAIDMGHADFRAPRQFAVPVVEGTLAVPTTTTTFAAATTVSMGNPHVVLFVEALPSRDEATHLGRLIEHDAARFPERVNVEWAVLRPHSVVDVLVWERGAGLTQACGTGACAVVAALVKTGRLQPSSSPVTVRLPGGPLAITCTGLDQPLWMAGPVRAVFAGVVLG